MLIWVTAEACSSRGRSAVRRDNASVHLAACGIGDTLTRVLFMYQCQRNPGVDGMTIDVDPDVHAQLAAAAAAAAQAGGQAVTYCDVIRGLLHDASRSG